MPSAKDPRTAAISRRRSLLDIAVFAGAAGLLGAGMAPRRASAATTPQKVVAYQDTPKDKRRCDGCVQWLPPQSCKVVEGVISPSGWCSLFAPKT